MKPPSLPRAEIERLCELAALGAGLAGAAFGLLLDAQVEPDRPRVRAPAAPTSEALWCTGILFEAEGDWSGLVAIVLPRGGCDLAAELMLGRADPERDLTESALRELGNIIASQTVSAMADSLGATILLSVPTLVLEDAGRVLRSLISQRGSPLRIETALRGRDAEVDALLVFAPDPPKLDAL